MHDYRTSYATPSQIDSLWTAVGTLTKQLEQVMGQIKQLEASAGGSAIPAEAAGQSASGPG